MRLFGALVACCWSQTSADVMTMPRPLCEIVSRRSKPISFVRNSLALSFSYRWRSPAFGDLLITWLLGQGWNLYRIPSMPSGGQVRVADGVVFLYHHPPSPLCMSGCGAVLPVSHHTLCCTGLL